MSDQFPQGGRDDFRQRLMSNAEADQQEIQDFLNARGGMIFGVILAIIVGYFLLRMFL